MERWDATRELFTDWVANNPLRDDLRDITWMGMSIWWALSPTQKIIDSEECWYSRFHNKLHGLNNHFNKNKNKNKFFFVSLFKSLINNIIIKLIYRKNFNFNFNFNINNDYIWFHSLSYNITKIQKDALYDRLYSKSINLDSYNKKESAYIIKYYSNNRLNFRKWINEREKLKKLTRPYVLCDRYIGTLEICKIYFISLIYKIRVLTLINKNKRLFFINGFDMSEVLRPLILDSFSGDFQESLIYARAMMNFYRKELVSAPLIVTYGELLPCFRAVCHVLKMNPIFANILTIQHAYAGKNKLPSYHRRSEFDNLFKNISPRPDLFLVQGEQYSNVLSEYIPKSDIKIIGCLKYDDFYEVKNNWSLVKSNVLRRLKIPAEKKVIVLAPSVGDLEVMIDFLRNSNEIKNFYIILSPHPIIKDITVSKFKEKSITSFVVSDFSTLELLSVADLVVAGISVIALESGFFGVNSLRLVNKNNPPQHDPLDGVPTVDEISQFDGYLRQLQNSYPAISVQLQQFFFKLDGNAGKRLWHEICSYQNQITSSKKTIYN